MPICSQCGFEVEEGEMVYCRSCFDLLEENLSKVQKELKQLKNENKELRNRVELAKLGRGRKWKKKKFPWR